MPERDAKLSTCDICHKRVPSVSLIHSDNSSGEFDACELCRGNECNHEEYTREVWKGRDVAQCVGCGECWPLINGQRRKWSYGK